MLKKNFIIFFVMATAMPLMASNRELAKDILMKAQEYIHTISHSKTIKGYRHISTFKTFCRNGELLKRSNTFDMLDKNGNFLYARKEIFDMENKQVAVILSAPNGRQAVWKCQSDKKSFWSPRDLTNVPDDFDLEDDTYQGKAAWKITLTPQGGKKTPKYVFWVDKETGFEVKNIEYEENGKINETIWDLVVEPVFPPDEFIIPDCGEVIECKDLKEMFAMTQDAELEWYFQDVFSGASGKPGPEKSHFPQLAAGTWVRLGLAGAAAICLAGAIVLKLRRRRR